MRCSCRNRFAPIPCELIAAFIAGAVVALLLPSWLLLIAIIAIAAFAVWRLFTEGLGCRCR
ncbi:MAG: hypothetical protein VB111_01145 [Clostridiaceae bacterium]|nr:hypothetical protein [Clostridiaceae bacterium]